LSALKAQDLNRALRLSGATLNSGIAEYFGRGGDLLVQKLVATDDLPQAAAILKCLRAQADRRFLLRHPVRCFAACILTVARRVARFFRPTGLFVVLVGPDGVGKSTSCDKAVKAAFGAFRRTGRFHWRPGFLPKLGGSNRSGQVGNHLQAPPDASAYRGVVSLLRFVYYWLDFVIGYWLVIYPRLAQSTLIVGERYFPDVMVQPERYGFAVPYWLMRGAAWLVPKPDLVVLLEDEPDVIHARKPELSPERVAELLVAYKIEIRRWGNARILNTKGGPDAVAEGLASMIIEERAGRTGRRLARKH
jgi:thymidylate kinase